MKFHSHRVEIVFHWVDQGILVLSWLNLQGKYRLLFLWISEDMTGGMSRDVTHDVRVTWEVTRRTVWLFHVWLKACHDSYNDSFLQSVTCLQNSSTCVKLNVCLSQSWHTYEWVVSHIWMSHVTHMNESWHTYEWVISHIWMSRDTHMNESCRHTYEWVMSNIRMSRLTHMNESSHTYE